MLHNHKVENMFLRAYSFIFAAIFDISKHYIYKKKRHWSATSVGRKYSSILNNLLQIHTCHQFDQKKDN